MDASPLLVPALLVLVSLVVFVAMLALKKKSGRGQREARALGGQADAKAGTKFVEENGEVVRRSTRVRKAPVSYEGETVVPPTPAPAKTPAKKAAETPAPAVTPKTTTKTPVKAEAVEATPKTTRTTRAKAAEAEKAEPVSTRAKRTPRA